jgi:predicted amidohydrolase
MINRTFLYPKTNASKQLKIACVTMQCDLEPERNRERMVALIADVIRKYPDVELILFGEAILGWYARHSGTKAYQNSIAETIPGNITRMISALAEENSVFISFGMTESCKGDIYNTQVLISPEGKIVAAHRKYHLMESAEIFKPGGLPVTIVEINGIRTGIIVCSDIQSTDVRKALKTQKVELILGGLASPSDPNFFISGMIAKMFDAWVVTANRYGDEEGYHYDGNMVIGNPLGYLQSTAVGKEQYLYEDLFFVLDEPALKIMLRRTYVWLSFIPYLARKLVVMLRQKLLNTIHRPSNNLI